MPGGKRGGRISYQAWVSQGTIYRGATGLQEKVHRGYIVNKHTSA
jgi:hypothetical protein